MKPLPLVHLPAKVMMIVPIITNSVVKAAHGPPPARGARLARAIVHAELLLAELKSAKLILDRQQRETDVA